MDISLFNINNTKNYNNKLNKDYFHNYFKDICSLMSEFLIYTIDNVNVQNNKYYLFLLLIFFANPSFASENQFFLSLKKK